MGGRQGQDWPGEGNSLLYSQRVSSRKEAELLSALQNKPEASQFGESPREAERCRQGCVPQEVALAFESGMGIIPLGNGEAPRSEDPTVWRLPLGIKFPV